MAGDFNKPATSDTYTAFASSVRDIAADLAKGLDPAVVSTTNIPTNAIRWTSASNKWQKWNGSSWVDLSSLYAINISGNAATATSATNASAVPWSGVSSKPTTIVGFGITDLVASILASFRKDNWLTNGVVAAVSGLMAWKNYGNNHVIFDASAGTAPDGSAVNNTTAATVWSATLPTLMGWNGSTTYGVRVDAARWADGATTANTAAACSGNSATATYATSAGSATTAAACSGNATTATTATSANAIADGAVSSTAKMANGIVTAAKLGATEQKQIVKAWVNFDGTAAGTITPRANYNVSSVTKNGTGDYTLNFSAALADANYALMGCANGASYVSKYNGGAMTTTAVRISSVLGTSGGAVDAPYVMVGISGN